ncbi:5-hydroxytryptamine receptor 5B-like [Tupaia chinensis]|uniref:5-hydroxytryptamine receptor 5B-like n=1 Tax=Tupaia chinensis TaxID=246437 RepID=UPI0003C8CCA5|nr:5-hydroxytryptamine receptor 5B-like [Tupaia chinensis]
METANLSVVTTGVALPLGPETCNSSPHPGKIEGSTPSGEIQPAPEPPVSVFTVLVVTLLVLLIAATFLWNLLVLVTILRVRTFHRVPHNLVASTAVSDVLVAALGMPLSLVSELSAGRLYIYIFIGESLFHSHLKLNVELELKFNVELELKFNVELVAFLSELLSPTTLEGERGSNFEIIAIQLVDMLKHQKLLPGSVLGRQSLPSFSLARRELDITHITSKKENVAPNQGAIIEFRGLGWVTLKGLVVFKLKPKTMAESSCCSTSFPVFGIVIVPDSDHSHRCVVVKEAPHEAEMVFTARCRGTVAFQASGDLWREQKEKRAAMMVGILIGVFVLCWIPFFLTELISPLCSYSLPPIWKSIFLWLGYSNSFFNPLIYTAFNKNYNNAFKSLFMKQR